MLKKEWGAESNGKLPHPFISGKTAGLVPEFAVEDLPLVGTATLVPEFAVEDLPLGKTATLIPELAVEECLWQKCNLGSCACSEGLALGPNTLMMTQFEYNILS